VTRDQALCIIHNLIPQLRVLGIRDIAVFGSVARDAADVTSDVDILVDFLPDAESFDNFIEVSELLDAHFEVPVDLVTVNGLSPYVAPYVLQEAIHAKIA